MFSYVTPGRQGVNTSSIFSKGITRYGLEKNIVLTAFVLEIPGKPCKRPDEDIITEFIAAGLREDSPVAFLNLSNGTLGNLENWHWVTILSLDTDALTAVISDQGKSFEINLREWIKTSILGGSMVYTVCDRDKNVSNVRYNLI